MVQVRVVGIGAGADQRTIADAAVFFVRRAPVLVAAAILPNWSQATAPTVQNFYPSSVLRVLCSYGRGNNYRCRGSLSTDRSGTGKRNIHRLQRCPCLIAESLAPLPLRKNVVAVDHPASASRVPMGLRTQDTGNRTGVEVPAIHDGGVHSVRPSW